MRQITRKDGIVYERKEKKNNYDAILYLRLSGKTLEKLKERAFNIGVPYTKLAREILDEYVESEEINERLG